MIITITRHRPDTRSRPKTGPPSPDPERCSLFSLDPRKMPDLSDLSRGSPLLTLLIQYYRPEQKNG